MLGRSDCWVGHGEWSGEEARLDAPQEGGHVMIGHRQNSAVMGGEVASLFSDKMALGPFVAGSSRVQTRLGNALGFASTLMVVIDLV